MDEWPKNNGVYKRYTERCWRSWVQQHVYPENSANYNAISLQIIINVLARMCMLQCAGAHTHAQCARTRAGGDGWGVRV